LVSWRRSNQGIMANTPEPPPRRGPGLDHIPHPSQGAATVITRIWRGWTTPENADAYQRIVSQEVLPGIAAHNLDGYHGAYLLRRDLDGEVEFATIMLFDSLTQVRAFAGQDYETAYVPPRARAVLTRFEERSAHYDTLLRPHTP